MQFQKWCKTYTDLSGKLEAIVDKCATLGEPTLIDSVQEIANLLEQHTEINDPDQALLDDLYRLMYDLDVDRKTTAQWEAMLYESGFQEITTPLGPIPIFGQGKVFQRDDEYVALLGKPFPTRVLIAPFGLQEDAELFLWDIGERVYETTLLTYFAEDQPDPEKYSLTSEYSLGKLQVPYIWFEYELSQFIENGRTPSEIRFDENDYYLAYPELGWLGSPLVLRQKPPRGSS